MIQNNYRFFEENVYLFLDVGVELLEQRFFAVDLRDVSSQGRIHKSMDVQLMAQTRASVMLESCYFHLLFWSPIPCYPTERQPSLVVRRSGRARLVKIPVVCDQFCGYFSHFPELF